jgi:hypothetical protein
MRFSYAIAAASALTLVLAAPASAVTGSATAGALSVTFTVDDLTFTGPECIEAPLRVTFSGAGNLDLAASKAGSSNSVNAFSYSFEAGTVTDSLLICPAIDGAGTYIIRGSVTGDGTSAPLPSGLSFVVSRAPAKVSGLQARQSGQTLTIKGRATALSNRGDIGVQSDVKLQLRLSKAAGGKGRWVTLGTVFPDQFGAFTLRGLTKQQLKGAEIRAILAPSDWAGETTGATRVR